MYLFSRIYRSLKPCGNAHPKLLATEPTEAGITNSSVDCVGTMANNRVSIETKLSVHETHPDPTSVF